MSNIPTLALIPSAYNTSKVYSVLPSNGDGDFTFSRSSSATRVNQDGLIETVEVDVPRIDYSDGGCPSLLLEPSRTNSVTNSEPTANEGATSGVTYESYFWENGLSNAVRFISSGSISYRYCGTATASVDNILSFYILMDDLSEPIIGTSSVGNDLSIVVAGVVATNITKKHVGNNIWRVSGKLTAGVSLLANNGIIKYATHTDKGFVCTGFQVEQGEYATSYIPTNGGQATRDADFCVDSGSADVFNDDEGVLFIETKALVDLNSNRYMMISDGAFTPYTNQIIFQYRSDGNFRVYFGGLGTNNIAFVVTGIDLSENHKIAFQYKFNDNKLFIDGIEQSPYASFVDTTLSGLNKLSFALNNNPNFMWKAAVKDLRYYDTVLTDVELTELTTQ